MKAAALLSCLAVAAVAVGETIQVPAGETKKVEPGRVFTGDVLVKTGPGTLDLTGASLKNKGLEIREGAVRMVGGGAATVTTRYLKWNVTKTRPAKAGPPEYANSGSQFSEFRLFRGGKMLPRPQNATALNGRAGWREGPQNGIDGDLKTKCYFNPFIADFGEEVTFDGYSFATANDAIGRDPYAWTVEAGVADGSAVRWVGIGAVDKFEAPKERFAEAGTVFPVSLRDVVPVDYPVTVCGTGRLILANVNETLERVCGTGLIQLERASVEFAPGAAFAGSVVGDGAVSYKKQ
ncbi:MAG: hypothetical protein ACI4RA_04190 [Kiritimatiellia bacterium]